MMKEEKAKSLTSAMPLARRRSDAPRAPEAAPAAPAAPAAA